MYYKNRKTRRIYTAGDVMRISRRKNVKRLLMNLTRDNKIEIIAQ